MKAIIHLCIVFILFSCGHNIQNKPLIEEKRTNVLCSSNQLHSYTLYVAAHEPSCEKMPLIIVLDPHGDGNSSINYFIEAAEKYTCVIAASNLIKNNFPDYTKAINELIFDVKSKYPVGNTLFIGGFSGGARMAIAYSNLFPTNGILACGALATNDQIKASNTNIYSIMGIADFNFPEMADYIINPQLIPGNLFPEISGEIHQWSSSSTISIGIGFLLANLNETKNICFSSKELRKQNKKRTIDIIDSLLSTKEYIKAHLMCRNILHSKNMNEDNFLNQTFKSISESIEYLEEIENIKKSLSLELKLREAYYNALLISDIKWWEKEISVLETQIQKEKEIYNQYVYKRIKAFLGVMCYSLTRNNLSENNLVQAQKILMVYQLIEPQNPDMYYFNALFNLKKDNITQSGIFLKKAIEAGFTDTASIIQDFPGINIKEMF